MGTVSINGKTYTGNNISIINNQVFIDGVSQEKGLQGILEVRIEGKMETVSCDAALTITGDVGRAKAGNTLTIHGNVLGDAEAGNTLTCKNIGGDARAGNVVSASVVQGKTRVR